MEDTPMQQIEGVDAQSTGNSLGNDTEELTQEMGDEISDLMNHNGDMAARYKGKYGNMMNDHVPKAKKPRKVQITKK